MKRALLHTLEPGRICDVVDVGKEFEVHTNFYWVDVPDDTTGADTYNPDGTITKWHPLNQAGFAENAYIIARAIEYGDAGSQLDMLYKELAATGTISNTGPWFNHVTNVKSNIPKDDPTAVLAWNQAKFDAWQASTTGNTAPA